MTPLVCTQSSVPISSLVPSSGSQQPRLCPLPKRVCFDEDGENDELAFYSLKEGVSWLLGPPQKRRTWRKWRCHAGKIGKGQGLPNGALGYLASIVHNYLHLSSFCDKNSLHLMPLLRAPIWIFPTTLLTFSSQKRMSGYFLIFLVIVVFLTHLLERIKTLQALKERKPQKSSLIREEKVNKEKHTLPKACYFLP